METKSTKTLKSHNWTLVELMFAATLAAMLIALAYPIIINAMHQTKAATWQSVFIGEARTAQQKIKRTVQSKNFMNLLDEHTVKMYSTEGDSSTLYYDPEGDHKKDAIVVDTPDGKEVLCRYVSPISETEPIFRMESGNDNSRKRLRVALHVGDSPEEDEQKYQTGPGYQGVELRFTVFPRNTQEWHEF